MKITEKILIDNLQGVNKFGDFISDINGEKIYWCYGAVDGISGEFRFYDTAWSIRIQNYSTFVSDRMIPAHPFDSRREEIVRHRNELLENSVED